jgi:Protein of unknown function (DUF3761)
MRRVIRSACVAVVVAAVAASCDRGPVSEAGSRISSPLSPTSSSSVALSVSWLCMVSGAFAPATCDAPHSVQLAARISAAAIALPSPPSGLIGSVVGSTVTLTWSPPPANDGVTSFVIEAGSLSGRADLANFDTGTAATTLTATGVPAGVYFVRVRGKNSVGVSGPSNEVVLTVGGGAVPCASAPSAPAALAATSMGSTVMLVWQAPVGGCAATSYVIEAGSASGLANLANFNTGSAATSFTAGGVGSGTYFVRVRAVNAAGVSPASVEVTLVVGFSTPIPTPPTPTPPTPGLTCGGVPVPSLVNCINNQPPQAPTALCNDGVYSCSQTRSGTCSSGHGGVRCYVCPGPLC